MKYLFIIFILISLLGIASADIITPTTTNGITQSQANQSLNKLINNSASNVLYVNTSSATVDLGELGDSVNTSIHALNVTSITLFSGDDTIGDSIRIMAKIGSTTSNLTADAAAKLFTNATIFEHVHEDAAHVSGQAGILGLGVQSTTTGALGANGDNEPFQLDANGNLKVNSTQRSPYPDGAVKWSYFGNSSANTLMQVTAPAVAGKTNYVLGYIVYNTGAALGASGEEVGLYAGSTLKILDCMASSAAIGSSITSPGMGAYPILQATSSNQAVTLQVPAAGSSVVMKASMWGYYI